MRNKNLKGFAYWLKVQFQEEVLHGMKFFNHTIDHNGKISLEKIDILEISWDQFWKYLKMNITIKRKITEYINNLLTLPK